MTASTQTKTAPRPDISLVVDNTDQHWNDARWLGKSTPAMVALLNTTAILLNGGYYGERDHRNTQDGFWEPVAMTWRA